MVVAAVGAVAILVISTEQARLASKRERAELEPTGQGAGGPDHRQHLLHRHPPEDLGGGTGHLLAERVRDAALRFAPSAAQGYWIGGTTAIPPTQRQPRRRRSA